MRGGPSFRRKKVPLALPSKKAALINSRPSLNESEGRGRAYEGLYEFLNASEQLRRKKALLKKQDKNGFLEGVWGNFLFLKEVSPKTSPLVLSPKKAV